MSDIIRLNADAVVSSFSSAHPPAIEVASGCTMVVETRDSYDRCFQGGAGITAYLRDRRTRASNPVTGPIFMRDLRPGDGLDVTIHRIALGANGYVAAVPGIGVLGDAGIVPTLAVFDTRPDGVWFRGRRLALRPNVGTIGVAPARGSVPTLDIGCHGGNLDCNDITEGTTLHLPVYSPGGLLALGDVHARMGFGEVYSGVNIDAEVTLSLARMPDARWEQVWFEDASSVMTLGVGPRVEDAIEEATRGMTALLCLRLGVSMTEAIVLTGAACDIRLGQASKFGVNVSCYAVMPKAALEG